VHVVVDYAGMAPGDVVTMIWEGTQGSGSQQQAAKVETVQPIVFPVSNATIMPNYNKTVWISYTVKRAGESSVMTSPTLSLLIQSLALQGSATFNSGTTGFYRCTAPSSITIPDDLPVGDVILTTSTSTPSPQVIVKNNSQLLSLYLINLVGSEAKAEATLFPTSMPGVGFRVVNTGIRQIAGPQSVTGQYVYSTNGAIELVKIGPITPGTLAAGVLAQMLCGSNRLYFMGWELMNDVAINVVRRRTTKGKR
jgi:hypothetical protein